MCVNECNILFFCIPTYFPTDLPTTIPVVYPIYDFSENLSVKMAWFYLIFFVETFRMYYWELFEMVGKNWLDKMEYEKLTCCGYHIYNISTLSVKTAWF